MATRINVQVAPAHGESHLDEVEAKGGVWLELVQGIAPVCHLAHEPNWVGPVIRQRYFQLWEYFRSWPQ